MHKKFQLNNSDAVMMSVTENKRSSSLAAQKNAVIFSK